MFLHANQQFAEGHEANNDVIWLAVFKQIIQGYLTAVGVLPIWQLYEVWCFLKMKRVVCEVLHIDTKDPDDLQYIHEKTTTMFNPFSDSEMSDSVTYDNKENGDQIELGYQYSYKRTKDGVHDDVYSVTGVQKPDIVMNIHKHGSGIVLRKAWAPCEHVCPSVHGICVLRPQTWLLPGVPPHRVNP